MRRNDASLRAALEANGICIYAMMIDELACDNLRKRAILADLQLLPQATVATNGEAGAMIEQHRLMARGLDFVDVHVLVSAKLSSTMLWTRDKRLATIAEDSRPNEWNKVNGADNGYKIW